MQRVGMLEAWLAAFPRTIKPLLEYTDDILRLPSSQSLSHIIADGPNASLSAVENAQPAILVTSVAILRVLEEEFGFRVRDSNVGLDSQKRAKGRVDYVLGHSLGEFSALVAAGNISFGDAVLLVRRRAEMMARCSDKARATNGDVGMVALVCESEEHLIALLESIALFLDPSSSPSESSSSPSTLSLSAAEDNNDITKVPHVSIANINSKTQLVLSGSIPRIATLLAHLRQFGGHDPRHVRINTDCPFHSPFMAPAATAMLRMLEEPSPSTDQEIIFSDESSDKSRALNTIPSLTPGLSRDSSHLDSPSLSTMTITTENLGASSTFVPCISNITACPFPLHSPTQMRDLLARSCVETVRWWASVQYLDRNEGVRRWVGIGPGKVGRNLVGKEVGIRGEEERGLEVKHGGLRSDGDGSGKGDGSVSGRTGMPPKGGGVWAVTHPREAERFLREFDACEGS